MFTIKKKFRIKCMFAFDRISKHMMIVISIIYNLLIILHSKNARNS